MLNKLATQEFDKEGFTSQELAPDEEVSKAVEEVTGTNYRDRLTFQCRGTITLDQVNSISGGTYTDAIVFGRDATDSIYGGVRINHTEVSRAHCKVNVQRDPDGILQCFWVEDTNSKNGTIVNGEEIAKGKREGVEDPDFTILQMTSSRITYVVFRVGNTVCTTVIDPEKISLYRQQVEQNPKKLKIALMRKMGIL